MRSTIGWVYKRDFTDCPIKSDRGGIKQARQA